MISLQKFVKDKILSITYTDCLQHSASRRLLILDRFHFEMQTRKNKDFKASLWLNKGFAIKMMCAFSVARFHCEYFLKDNAGSSAHDIDIVSMVVMEGLSS